MGFMYHFIPLCIRFYTKITHLASVINNILKIKANKNTLQTSARHFLHHNRKIFILIYVFYFSESCS